MFQQPALQPDEIPSLAQVDGQVVNLATYDDLLRQVRQRGLSGRGFSLFTLNLDHLVKRRANPSFRAAYDRATFVTADGAPVVALARRQGASITRTTGSDMIGPLCAMAARENLPLFFFGSSLPLLERAKAELTRLHPGLEVAGMEAPPFGFDPVSPAADAAADRIAASGASFCLVALGAPKQELFADRMLARHPQLGFFCIGASLDFVAGGQTRAPLWMQKAQLEWAWRMLSDPRRMLVRYLRCATLLLELKLQPRPATSPRPGAS